MYWRPIFAYIRRVGFSPEDAQDLTQEFFVAEFEDKLVPAADPARGRFRSLLLKTLQNFLGDVRDRARTRQRGGNARFVPIEEWMAEAPSRLSLHEEAIENRSAEQLFDLRWAATIAEEALRRLSVECQNKRRRKVFEKLSPYLTADRDDIPYAQLVFALRLEEPTVKRLLRDMRARYRSLLREEVGRTVVFSTEVDDEIRYLCATLANEI
jgi:RNA polymerase sigma-70 factor (ECF subfamily)